MAMNAYTGIMGSGKSYEVVENVILPALLAGRRVVTNVAGLQVDDINAYLVEKFVADSSKLGVIVQVTNDQIPEVGFFPVEAKEGVETPQSIVQGGDLVVIDECWRWWATGCKISIQHMTFFRMHRHFVNEATKGTCDIALIVQDIGDLDRKIKVVVESTYKMTKLKALGWSHRYRVDVYAGYKIAKGIPKIREIQRAYDPEIFKLYSSYSQSSVGGKEGVIDKRGTIFGGWLFKYVLPIAFLLAIFAFWKVWTFFHRSVPAASASQPVIGLPGSALTPAAVSPQPIESDWRVKGYYMSRGRHVVVIVRGLAETLLVEPYGFTYDGFIVRGTYYDRVITNYTGTDAAEVKNAGSLPGKL